jgi:hypothetical protein
MGVRGSKIHQTLFGPEEEPEVSEDQRGRDPELLEQRNDHLLHRYVWYGTIRPTDYPWVIARLRGDFYLTESTIGQIIAANTDKLRVIRKENLSLKQLREKFPWW